MKYLLVILVIFVFAWIWRNSRDHANGKKQRKPQPPTVAKPQAMVACRHCGTHAPEADMVSGRQGLYCSVAHRDQQER